MKSASQAIVLEAVARFLNRYHMLPVGARVGVAVSGGADSVCLLDVLAALAPVRQWALTVLHLNHGWRGAGSDEDAHFVERLAARYGLPCVIARAPQPAASGNLEQQGRDARLRFFAEQRLALPLDCVSTGHTLDDQAETVLFRLLRGAGPGGLAGILPVTAEGLVRPLLGVERAAIRAHLAARGLEWREDPTNADTRFRRNALRAALPGLARLVNPAAPHALARLAAIALDEESHWDQWTAASAARLFHHDEDHAIVLELAPLLAEGPALARRLLRRALERVRGNLRSIDHGHVEQILAMAARRQGEARMRLPGLWVERSCGWLRLCAAPAAPLPESRHAGLVLRGWRPGDAFDGHPLRDRFRRRNIPRWRRLRWRVVASGSTIWWAEEFGFSSAGRAREPAILQLLSETADIRI